MSFHQNSLYLQSEIETEVEPFKPLFKKQTVKPCSETQSGKCHGQSPRTPTETIKTNYSLGVSAQTLIEITWTSCPCSRHLKPPNFVYENKRQGSRSVRA